MIVDSYGRCKLVSDRASHTEKIVDSYVIVENCDGGVCIKDMKPVCVFDGVTLGQGEVLSSLVSIGQ